MGGFNRLELIGMINTMADYGRDVLCSFTDCMNIVECRACLHRPHIEQVGKPPNMDSEQGGRALSRPSVVERLTHGADQMDAGAVIEPGAIDQHIHIILSTIGHNYTCGGQARNSLPLGVNQLHMRLVESI